MAISELGYEINTSQVLQASKDLDKLDQAEGKAAKSAGKLEGALLKAAKSAGILAAATFSVHKVFTTISSFEKSMSGVQAVTRASAEEMEALRDVAKDLGATTEYTASQAAEGLRFLGMAGFSTAESIAAIPQVLDLATASSMDLATAADIASNMMSAYGIAATDAGRITDVLAAAASRANTDVVQMGDGMKYVGPVAAAMGISINDTAAAIGVLSDAGIQGSMAGTGLRRVMSSLANATPKAAKTLRRMGLDINDLNPATNDLVDIVDRLANAGLSASDALTIFGDRGGPAILALVENNQKLQDLTSTLQDVDGEASKMAGTMRDNLQGSMDGLNSAIESVIIAMGESGLTAVLRAIIDTSASAVRAFSSFIEAANRITGVGSALGSAFEFLSGHIEVVGRAITSVALFMTGRWVVAFVAARAATLRMTLATIGFSGALVALRGALVRTGIGALVIAAGELVFRLMELRREVGGVANVFRVLWRTGGATINYLVDGAYALGNAFKGVALNIAAYFNDTWARVRSGFASLMEWVQGGINKMISALNKIPKIDIDLANFAEEYRAAANDVSAISESLRQDAKESFAAAREGFGNLVSPAQAFNAAVASIKAGMDSIDDAVASSETVQGGGIIDAVMGGGGEAAGGGGRGRKGKGVLDRLADDFEQLRESLMTELEITNEWFNEAELLMQAARHAGLIASEEEYLNYRERLHREYNDRLSQISGYYSDSALDQASAFFGDMAGAMQSGNEKMLKIGQAFAAAQSLINTWKGYTDALAQGGLSPWAKLAWGAKILSAGFGAISAIKGVSSSGSSNAKQAAQASAPAASAPQRTVNLTVQGEYFTGDTIQRIAEGLNDFIADGGNINVVRD